MTDHCSERCDPSRLQMLLGDLQGDCYLKFCCADVDLCLLQRSQTLHRARRGLPTRMPGLPQLPKLPRGPCPLPQEGASSTLALSSRG